MKKILITINSAIGGGAEKVLLEILKNLDKKKYEIDLFLIIEKGIYLEEFKKEVNRLEYLIDKENLLLKDKIIFKVIKIFYIKLFLLQKIRKIKDEYDIEISFLEGVTAEYISRRKNRSYKICWIHTDLKKRKMPFWIKSDVYKNIDRIICVSNGTANSLKELYPKASEKIEVIYNFISKKNILNKSLKYKENNKITFISIGRLTKEKGFDILLRAHKKLIDKGLDYNLQIIGEGILKKDLEKYIFENKIEENTKLLGFQKNPYSYLKASDVYIMSSRYEAFPLVLCEAIILEKPIIATNCIGAIEILENGKYGEIVKVDCVDSLMNSMEHLYYNSNLRMKYINLSKERSNFFDDEKIIKKLEKLFFY